jgi:hypothetical protein
LPAPKGKEQGIRQRFSARAGIDLPRWRGKNKQDDPGGIGDDEFQELINIRHKGTKLVNRPGLTRIHTTVLDGEVKGVFDPILFGGGGGDPELQEVAGVSDCSPVTGYGTSGARLYVLGRDTCSPNDYILYHFAKDQSPKLQKLHLDPHDGDNHITHNGGYSIHNDGDSLCVMVGGNTDNVSSMTMRRLSARHFGTPPVPVVNVTVARDLGDDTLDLLSGASDSVAFLGKRYFGDSTEWGAATTTLILNVWSFDGRNIVLEDTYTATPSHTNPPGAYGTALGQYREELLTAVAMERSVGAVSEYPDRIRKRTAGGTWSSLSLPAGVDDFAASFSRMAVYQDKLYILGHGVMPAAHATNIGGIVLSWDGSALAVAQNTISASSDGSSQALRCPVVFNGYLYYLHSPAGANTTVYVGRFDGSSWTNTHKQLSTQFAVAAHSNVTSLDVYQGNLVATVTNTSTGVNQIVMSPGTDTSGTWTSEFSYTGIQLWGPGSRSSSSMGLHTAVL